MKINLKKLTAAGMMAAIGVCLSAFSIPVGASKCFPIQHLLNVLAGVFFRSRLRGRVCVFRFPDPEPDGDGNFAGISWQHGRGVPVRGFVPENRENVDSFCRGIGRHRNPWGHPLLSCGKAAFGKSGSGYFYLCAPIFHQHGRGLHYGGNAFRRPL